MHYDWRVNKVALPKFWPQAFPSISHEKWLSMHCLIALGHTLAVRFEEKQLSVRKG